MSVVARERDDVMKVSRNGQVSLPASTRRRWNAERVLVVDMGDYLIMRPYPDDPIRALRGKYKGRGPTADEWHRANREEEREIEERKLAQWGWTPPAE